MALSMSREIFKKLESEFGPMLPGCVSTAMAKCGRSYCRCKNDDAFRHGPYYRWTGTINGKHTTITLTKEEAKECERRIKNYRRLQEIIDVVIRKSLDDAPWNNRE